MSTILFEKSVHDICHTNEKLITIIRKVENLKKIQAIFYKALSEVLFTSTSENSFNRELVNAIRVASYEKGCLQLLCDNAAISTRLRYLLPELIHSLRSKNALPNLVNINLKIAEMIMPTPIVPSKKVAINSKNSKLLKDILLKLKT